MQISYDTTTNQIRQFGQSLGDLDGCTITDIPDEEAAHLSENGTKAWDPNTQTIAVTPPEPVVVPDPSPDPRGVAFQALINTATSPEQAAAIEQVAAALGIILPEP